jgi:hypothetical protein
MERGGIVKLYLMAKMRVSFGHEIETETYFGRLVMHLCVVFYENYLQCSYAYDNNYHIGQEF